MSKENDIIYLCDICHRRRNDHSIGWETMIMETKYGLRAVIVCPDCIKKNARAAWKNVSGRIRKSCGMDHAVSAPITTNHRADAQGEMK